MRRAAFRAIVSLGLVCGSASAFAIDPITSLYCARKAAGLDRAELRAQEAGPYQVLVRFSRVRPSQRQLEWALRECLQTASKLDGSRDILASASFSQDVWDGEWKEVVEPLAPHGAANGRVVYRASSGRIIEVGGDR